jgi:hypothetical protein
MSKKSVIQAFRRPITVLRYFVQEKIWNKAEYRALPSHLPEWATETILHNGCVHKGQLCLNGALLGEAQDFSADTLLLVDCHQARWLELLLRSHQLPYFLNLHYRESELWVECLDDYYPLFGSQKRDRFDIVPLPVGQRTVIHINARYWHTLTGFGTDTHYVENYLYLENLGTFRQAEWVDGLEEPLRFQPQKEVDLRQMLF